MISDRDYHKIYDKVLLRRHSCLGQLDQFGGPDCIRPCRMLFPQNNKDLDNYPTVTIKGKGDKEDTISEEDCMKRFKVHFYWFHAKIVARYVNHNLVPDFMHPFNNPNYHCFRGESTSIAVDLMDGRTSFGHHSEIALNPLLSGKEGNILHLQITADLRKRSNKKEYT
ncbi:hypothetical protein HO173_010870 [Letharia columbiana]|uniref:Uncharacterized protein n=1 Tax=Letharia columbiana TaxID=112416 RepID=A0A8H6FLX7_9LECA|nr:uncharacterized protein HO173_010870 [Letharia columbiana]KAF6230962.1 hypothetical protein HO173_010870 [Letharia columbiana]